MESFAEDLRTMVRTPLHASHVDLLRAHGDERWVEPGEIVARLGAPATTFLYVLEGRLEAVDPHSGERYGDATLGPGQFYGELGILSGGVTMLSSRAVERSRLIVLDRETLIHLMSRVPEMSDIIVTVFAARRRRLLESNRASLTLIGAEEDRSLGHVAAFALRNKVPVRLLDLGTHEAREEARTCDVELDRPAALYGDRCIEDPSPARVARLLGLDIEVSDRDVFDVLIVGGGPSGIAAGVYAGSEGLRAVVVEDLAIGGQAGTSSRIENYMGFPTGISGADLCMRGEVQAMKFGTRFAVPRRARSLERFDNGEFCATLDDDSQIRARSVVVATGVQYRRLRLEGLERFEGAGVYYAATELEARYCADSEVIVVGGGNSAGQAAMFLSRFARRVLVVVRGNTLSESMSDYLRVRLQDEPSIEVCFETQLQALRGDERLEQAVVVTASGAVRSVGTPAVFIMVGAAPNTQWLSGLVRLDQKGFVLTGEQCSGPSAHSTSCPGVFAVGDVRAGSVKRVASAVGDGSVVVSEVWRYLRTD